ncbi:MAG: molybdate ABC transporter substrate-binding protein [Planctomycetota bacterium]|nr:MAG: molybdate ABC transporter substrate-binding protein [Planctomycetota bacterium]
MRGFITRSVVCLALLLPSFGCAPARTEGLPPISAAASTRRLLEELCELYAREHGLHLRVSAAASSTLARQIEKGKPFALYVSAHPQWVSYLLKRGWGDPASEQDWLRNQLVWVRHVDADFALGEGPSLPAGWSGRLSLGNPEHVPVGYYAKQALQHVGLWESFRPQAEKEDAPMIVPAANASAGLRNVSTAQCECGIVYLSDAQQSPKIEVLYQFAPDSHSPIRYPILLPKGAGPEIRAFVQWLFGPEAAQLIRRHGFEPVKS